jgi:RNA polymerase sigma-70 factor (ECF subfamily)
VSAKVVPLRRVSGDVVEMSDEALVAACGTGDVTALGALFDRFHTAVFRFAGRLSSSDEMGRDDLVQATFLELPRAARSYRGTSTVKTWILGIAVNVARHALRGERRRRARQARYLDHMTAMPPHVDEQVEQRMLLARVEEVVAGLPRDLQVAFILCDLERLPSREVAQVLEIPEGTLWRRLHNARKAVRDAIEEGSR